MNCQRFTLTLLLLFMAMTVRGQAIEIHDSFDDHDLLDDSPVSWGKPSNTNFDDGDLVLFGNGTGIVTTFAEVEESAAGWSIQAQARLGGSYYFGLMDDAGPTPSGFMNGWSMMNASGTVYLESVFETFKSVSTGLRPTREDVILQVDSFNDLFQVWAWAPDESRPEEPLLEHRLHIPESRPTLWVRNPSGGEVEARFRWARFSSESSLPDPSNLDPSSGDFDQDGVIGIADIALISRQIQAGTNDLYFDLTRDRTIDSADLTELVKSKLNTWIGDSNLDGLFDSGDLVSVFQAGEYEDGIASNSTWATGDWNGDGDFDTGDLVAAFQDSGFEAGERLDATVVPEPAHSWLLAIVSLWAIRRTR